MRKATNETVKKTGRTAPASKLGTKPARPRKTFDAVEMKRDAQKAIRRELGDMTPAQEAAYWRQQNEDFHQRLDRAQRRRKAS